MKIICIGRNYAAHAAELNNPVNTDPVVFLKPDTALLRNNDPFYYPDFSQDIHFELEVVYRVHKAGKYVPAEHTWRHLDAVGLGIDFTARDLQQRCKEKGLPWEIAKAFNHSAAISALHSLDRFAAANDLRFRLLVNGEERQNGHTADMIFPIEKIVAYVSQFFTLNTGDLIFTGTPSGVGSIQVGDRLTAYLEDQQLLDFEIK